MFGRNSEIYREKLIKTINECNLPLALGYYILKDVFLEVQNIYFEDLKQEKELPSIEQDGELEIEPMEFIEDEEEIKEEV